MPCKNKHIIILKTSELGRVKCFIVQKALFAYRDQTTELDFEKKQDIIQTHSRETDLFWPTQN